MRARLAALQAKHHAAAALANAQHAAETPAPNSPPMSISMDEVIRRFLVTGKVQGVYFRHSARLEAERSSLRGSARNLADGSVEVLARGSLRRSSRLQRMVAAGSGMARVDSRSSKATPPSRRNENTRRLRGPLKAPGALPALHDQGRVRYWSDAAVVAGESARPIVMFGAQVVAKNLAAHADVRRDFHQLIVKHPARAARMASPASGRLRRPAKRPSGRIGFPLP